MQAAPDTVSRLDQRPKIDIERIRFSREPAFADRLATELFAGSQGLPELPTSERVRRRLLTSHVKLTENMAPEVFNYAKRAATSLELRSPVEIYQAAGEENAANWICPGLAFISLQGKMVSLLDEESFVALFGHEFGHHIAHTDTFAATPRQHAIHVAASAAYDGSLPTRVRILASRLAMAKEFTADRFAALATTSLDGPLRLLMTVVTGLPSERLKVDGQSYLEQARALFFKSDEAETPRLGSHPEHLLRAYALSLFADSDVFKQLTGAGAGTRSLADIDAELEGILTGSEEHIFEAEKDQALPPEVQEFALCAAVLLAHADGEISEGEITALEETFSEVLPDWKELLDHDQALERYQELLPLMIAGGVPVASSVFSVLVHVMMADAEVHVRELEIVSAVGRSLHQEILFDYLLSSTARAFRIDRSQREDERPLPALPPGDREAQAALKALFVGMSRRGGGTVALSRLLRILGKNAWEASVLSILENAARGHHLELAAVPVADEKGSIHLDQTLLFRLSDAEVARREETALATDCQTLATAKTRDALLVALKLLRERLVSGDGRSPSIRLYQIRGGRHFDLAQLDKIIAGRSERIVTQLHEETTIPLLSGDESGFSKTASDFARSIRNLDREFKARVEETGSKDFYVGYPFLVGVVNGFFVRAPLILHPFSLSGDSRGGSSYTLKRRDDDEAIANQALLRLLFAKKGFPFTETLANDLDAKAAQGGAALLDALRDIGLVANPLTGTVRLFEDMNASAALLLPEGLSVSENAVAGFFPQSNSDLLQDYDELLERLNSSDQSVLAETLNAACDMLPAAYRPAFVPPPVTEESADQPIIYADPSQRHAVMQSRATRLLVMDGPPGTGKSQTIVNLVADTLARGGKVAVVCEKRVALDVVKQRLDGAGIGHLAAVVHDVLVDRKALYTHIADRLEAPERRSHALSRLEELKNEAELLESQLRERSRWLAHSTPSGLTVGQLHSMASGLSAPSVSAAGLEQLDVPALRQLTIAVKASHPFMHLLAASSPFRSPEGVVARPSLAQADADKLQKITRDLDSVCTAAAAYGELYAENPTDPTVLEGAESALRATALQAATFEAASPPELPGQMITLREQNPSAARELEDAWDRMESHRSAAEAEKERVQTEVSPELTAAISVARASARSFFRFLKPSWRKACGTIRDHLLREWPEQAGAKIDPELLAKIERRAKASIAWKAAATIYRTLQISSSLPRQADELYAQTPNLLAIWKHSAGVAQAKPILQSLGLWPLDASALAPSGGWKGWSARCEKRLRLLEAQRTYYAAVDVTGAAFPQVPHLQHEGLVALRDAFVRDSSTLVSMDRALEKGESLLPGFRLLAETLTDTQGTATPSAWADSVQHGWAEAHLTAARETDPTIHGLAQPAPLGSAEGASARLLELHENIASEEALRLAALNEGSGLMAIPPAEARARRTPQQSFRENLIRECRRQRSVTPMRTLVRKTAADGLLDVVPIWLMSPETTAILFPRAPVFDLLIIDEASQCTVENGLPVLTRARQAVVAGDDKQMPPTSFFKSGSGLDGVGTDEESEEAPSDSFDAESLLVLARQGSAGAPLRWHYRALFEELIAFSNHSMYGGSLLTIPAVASRSAPPALRWVRLENGTWDKGANLPEARRVVDLLGELIAQPKPPSIGVVTFNLVQRRAIMDEIDFRRSTDERFTQLYDSAASAEALDERPFVKNLESVQGDERDVIIFSLGYAPVPRTRRDGSEETYVPARFGPLGQKGGERRLNVAVSRAKKEIVVVSSFDPSMLSVAKAKNDGPRLFKSFVEFARHLGEGRRTHAEKVLSLVNDTRQNRRELPKSGDDAEPLYFPLAHQITLELEAAGLKVETMIGSSEFRLPVAVVHPSDAHRYTVAILCDEGDKVSDIYEDYVHVPNILARRKWRQIRVNSHDWHRNKSEIVTSIKSAVA